MAQVIRHAVSNAFYEAGTRIKFQGFGNSNYKSREMGEALKLLEKAMLIYLLYPSSSVEPPLLPNIKKSPRLQVLDTGMLNYFAGFQKDLFGTRDIEVKSGPTGRLRSLHQFVDRAPHNFTVRIYSGQLKVDQIKTLNGKNFLLFNLPFYLTGCVSEYLKWFINDGQL